MTENTNPKPFNITDGLAVRNVKRSVVDVICYCDADGRAYKRHKWSLKVESNTGKQFAPSQPTLQTITPSLPYPFSSCRRNFYSHPLNFENHNSVKAHFDCHFCTPCFHRPSKTRSDDASVHGWNIEKIWATDDSFRCIHTIYRISSTVQTLYQYCV